MRRHFDTLLLVVAVLILWQLAFWIWGEATLAAPGATWDAAVVLTAKPTFWAHVRASAAALGLATLWASLAGLAVGLALGLNRASGEVFDPILGSLYSIPKITLYPIILLIFGLGLPAKVAFGAIHGFFPVAIFTMNGVRHVNPIFFKATRALKLSTLATVTSVVLPASLPEVLTGLRVGFATTILGTLIGELFAADSGVGTLLIKAMMNQDLAQTAALTLLIFLFAIVANAAIAVLTHFISHQPQP